MVLAGLHDRCVITQRIRSEFVVSTVSCGKLMSGCLPTACSPVAMPCQSSDKRRGGPAAWRRRRSYPERDTACRRSRSRCHASEEAAATSQAVSLSLRSCGEVCSDCHDSARSGAWAGDAGTVGRRTLRSCAGVLQPFERNSVFCQPCTHEYRAGNEYRAGKSTGNWV
jgi:hypothetical protein